MIEDQPATRPEPPERWLCIDARSSATSGAVSALSRLAGVPLVARHVRTAARLAFGGAVIVVDQSARPEVERALVRYPSRRGFAVELAAAPPDDTGRMVSVAATADYSQELLGTAPAGSTPVPARWLTSKSDLRTVENELFDKLRKSLDADGVVSYYFMRPASRLLTRWLVHTRVAPNHVSLLALACGIAAAVLAAPGAAYAPLAALLLWLGAAIDCIDGDLARLRLSTSRLGEWLDTVADDVSTFGFLAALGLGLGDGWQWLGVGGALAGAAAALTQYRDLVRLGLPIDTARYPWFFGTPYAGRAPRRGLVARLFYVVTFLFRRDAFITIVALATALGARRAAMVMLAAGALTLVSLLTVHKLVAARRPVDANHSLS